MELEVQSTARTFVLTLNEQEASVVKTIMGDIYGGNVVVADLYAKLYDEGVKSLGRLANNTYDEEADRDEF